MTKKKLSYVLIACMGVLCVTLLTACGDDSKETSTEPVSIEEKTTQATEAEITTAEPTTKAPTTTEAQKSDASFRQLMDEYEAFMDKYVEFMKKYKANPTDLSLISDYTKMASDLAEWSQKIKDIDRSTFSADDVKYYTEVVARVANKLKEVTP